MVINAIPSRDGLGGGGGGLGSQRLTIPMKEKLKKDCEYYCRNEGKHTGQFSN